MKAIYFVEDYGKFKKGDKAKLGDSVLQALLRSEVVSYEPPKEKPKKTVKK